MPQERMNEKQLAAYLHMDLRELLKLAQRGRIPCRKTAKGFEFRKEQVDHWVEIQMHELDAGRLAGIEKGVIAHHGYSTEDLVVYPLIPQGGVAVPLPARTRDSAIRCLVDLADKSGLVYVKQELAANIILREEMCSTAMIPAVALPHPRTPQPHDISASFVVAGLTASGIPFGALDGSLTRLFFLICCKDERSHLHVLARLARMLYDQPAVDRMLAANDSQELEKIIWEREKQVAKQTFRQVRRRIKVSKGS